jgi:hypothetical protein
MTQTTQEPAFILKNGQSIPYIPGTITTGRDAYAASLHVLFKHVADFHICVVRAFSAKYGIPEDDILKTIQESDEFKNMQVDPVIDALGYLAIPSEIQAPAKATPPTTKRKKTKTVSAPVLAAPVLEPVLAAPVLEPVLAAPVLAAPVLAAPVLEPVLEPVLAEPVLAAPVLAEPVLTEPVLAEPVMAPGLGTEHTTPGSIKVIRKKIVVPKPLANESNAIAIEVPIKIIKKKTLSASK